jgi:hypothetical protein
MSVTAARDNLAGISLCFPESAKAGHSTAFFLSSGGLTAPHATPLGCMQQIRRKSSIRFLKNTFYRLSHLG